MYLYHAIKELNNVLKKKIRFINLKELYYDKLQNYKQIMQRLQMKSFKVYA